MPVRCQSSPDSEACRVAPRRGPHDPPGSSTAQTARPAPDRRRGRTEVRRWESPARSIAIAATVTEASVEGSSARPASIAMTHAVITSAPLPPDASDAAIPIQPRPAISCQSAVRVPTRSGCRSRRERVRRSTALARSPRADSASAICSSPSSKSTSVLHRPREPEDPLRDRVVEDLAGTPADAVAEGVEVCGVPTAPVDDVGRPASQPARAAPRSRARGGRGAASDPTRRACRPTTTTEAAAARDLCAESAVAEVPQALDLDPPSARASRRSDRSSIGRPPRMRSTRSASEMTRPRVSSSASTDERPLLSCSESGAGDLPATVSEPPTRPLMGTARSVEEDLAEVDAARRVAQRPDRDARGVHLAEQVADALALRCVGIGAHEHEAPVGDRGHAGPHLLPGDHQVVAVDLGPCARARRGRSRLRAR